MKKVYLNQISYYLPKKVLSNADLSAEFPDWSVEKIAKKIGINQRHIAAKDEFSSDMGIAAAEKLFNDYELDRGDIDFLLFCTQSPDYFLPTTACIVQDKLGLSTAAGALDFNLGCSGFVYGLAVAKGLISGGIARNILLICAETYSKFLNKNDRGNRTIFGDAASATLISDVKKGYGAEILNFQLGTDGAGAENLIVKGGGMRHRNSEVEHYVDNYGNEMTSSDLSMNGPEIFNFTSNSIPNLVQAVLEKNDFKLEEISHYIFHQANAYMLNHLRKKIKIPLEKFPLHMDFCGNTVSSTIQIVISEMMKNGTLEKNDLALLAGFGVGYSWGGTVLKF
ncbi:MAG: 3-oxoacyl-[acyl-carrier-protein] synthase-3 [Halioglobus sp.]|jgi:3-oxoacyl-[acyl-carrier-protein] synthase-3